MRMKKLLVAVLAIAMLVTGITGTGDYVQAAQGSIKVIEESENIVKPGETAHIKMVIKATNLNIQNPVIDIKAANDTGSSFTFSNIKLNVGNGVDTNSVYTANTNLEFDVQVKETAKIGTYPVDITFSYRDFETGPDTCTISTKLKIQEEKTPAQLTISDLTVGSTNLGSKTVMEFVVKNEGEITAKNVYLKMDFGDSVEERYTVKDIKIGDLSSGATKKVSLPITILSSATVGRKTFTGNFTFKTVDGGEEKASYNIYVNLTTTSSATQAPQLTIDKVTYKEGLKPGDEFNLSVKLTNAGGSMAKNIKVVVDESSIDAAGILKKFYTDGVSVANMSDAITKTVNIPLSVSKYATGGMKAVKLVITYYDENNGSYTLNETVYVDVTATTVEGTPSPNIVINNVTQVPSQPVAGGQVEVSFDLENKSNVDISDLKIMTEGLTSATFIPVESEPYQYIEKLKGGEKIRITIPLNVSEDIVEGLNNITVKYTYAGGEGSVTIPIRDVQNDVGGISKPKLIVSKFTTDKEELRAGSTFNFTFDLYNTNATVAAKNITVTVTQPDNIFTVTQGSNSFFINKIDPGETVSSTLEMKVKSDATTKAYEVQILIEYEYDGAEANPTTGEVGESRTQKLNLQAVENSRPVVDYVNVYSWDGSVIVGNTATLSFEFYNMGKSPLNNVVAIVEGDFAKADGNMHFVGNVAEGSSSYVEFDVIPNMEGTASGVLRITFEDSNGDEVEFTKDFTAEVMGAGVIDPGPIDDGSGEVFNPGGVTAKKAILPIWAFVIIEVVIFLLFVPITRKIIISIYKAKLRKSEQEKY